MVTNSKKTKKVVSEADDVVKLARGERLQKLRNLANLSREELCDTPSLNTNTFKGWELGRFYGLSREGAAHVVERVAKENVLCTVDWLMDGIGAEPIVIFSNPDLMVSDKTIQKELSIFQVLYHDVGILYTEIKDLNTHSFFQFGDVVVGVKLPLESAIALIGQLCLVETVEKNIMIVKLLKKLGNNQFLSSSLAGDNQTELSLLNIARITRLYRPV